MLLREQEGEIWYKHRRIGHRKFPHLRQRSWPVRSLSCNQRESNRVPIVCTSSSLGVGTQEVPSADSPDCSQGKVCRDVALEPASTESLPNL